MSMKKISFFALLAVAAMCFSACGGNKAVTLDFAGKILRPVELNGVVYDEATTEEPAMLVFSKEGNNLGGSAGCNKLMGNYYASGDTLNVNIMGLTMMMCTPESGEFERALVEAMAKVNRYEYDEANNRVSMLNGEELVAIFSVEAAPEACCGGHGEGHHGHHHGEGHQCNGEHNHGEGHVCQHQGDSAHVCQHHGEEGHVCQHQGEEGHVCQHQGEEGHVCQHQGEEGHVCKHKGEKDHVCKKAQVAE